MTLDDAFAYLAEHGARLGGRAMGGDKLAAAVINRYNEQRTNPKSGVLESLLITTVDEWLEYAAAEGLTVFLLASPPPADAPLRVPEKGIELPDGTVVHLDDVPVHLQTAGYPICGFQGFATMVDEVEQVSCPACYDKAMKEVTGDDDEAGAADGAQSSGLADGAVDEQDGAAPGGGAGGCSGAGVRDDAAPGVEDGGDADAAALDAIPPVGAEERAEGLGDGEARQGPPQAVESEVHDPVASASGVAVDVAAAPVTFPAAAATSRVFPSTPDYPYVFDHQIADCAACPLAHRCEATECTAQQPTTFNGVMIVGEAPNAEEARLKKPFLGPDGAQLETLLDQARIDRDECYMTYASLCQLDAYDKKARDLLLHAAIPACRPRLLAEIQQIQPRIIIAVGQSALNALTGHVEVKNKREPYTCGTCDGLHKWKRWACAKKGCKKVFNDIPFTDPDVKPDGAPCVRGCGMAGAAVTDEQVANQIKVLEQSVGFEDTPEARALLRQGLEQGAAAVARDAMLALCDTKPKKAPKFQPRTIKCPECLGLKTKLVTSNIFVSEHKLGGKHSVAGLVIPADTLEIGAYLGPTASETWVIPTYRVGLIRKKATTKAGKQIGGQFLASAMLNHLEKARRLVDSDPVFDLQWSIAEDPDALRTYLMRPGVMSCDIETNAKDPTEVTAITCIGFKLRGDPHTVVVPTAAKVEEGWSPFPLDHPLIQVVCDYLRTDAGRLLLVGDPDVCKSVLGQNFSYDITCIKRIWGVDVVGYDRDTLIAHNAVAPDEPHDLQHIAGIYTDAPPWKPPKESGGIQAFATVEELYKYNAKDVHITCEAMQKLEVELVKAKTTQVHALDIQKAALGLSMGEFGMPIDRAEQLKVGAECQFEAEVALKKMREQIGILPLHVRPKSKTEHPEYFNPNSNPQLQWALYDKTGPFKLVPKGFTDPKMTKPSADKNALLDYTDHPFVAALLEFRNNTKIKSTFIDGMPLGADMRLHTRWNPTGARTGRWTSSPNFQNWPKWIRSMVYALEGRMFVGADYSQLEMRILAALCGDPGLIAKCRDADESRKLEPEHDPHSYVAAMTFGETFTSLNLNDPNHDPKDRKCSCETCTRKMLRDIVKRTVYGLNYGAGSETVREAIYDGGYEGPPISIAMIEQTKLGYFTAFPDVPKWRDRFLGQAQQTGYIRDQMSGRYRQFPLREIDSTVAYNFPIQSAAATVMDVGALKLHARLPAVDPTAKIFALVHDAAYVECAEERAPAVAALVEECLSCQIRLGDSGDWMPLPAAAAIAKDWKKAG